jgi:hypothetical protein
MIKLKMLIEETASSIQADTIGSVFKIESKKTGLLALNWSIPGKIKLIVHRVKAVETAASRTLLAISIK